MSGRAFLSGLVAVLLTVSSTPQNVHADRLYRIELAGDVFEFLLPASAAGLSLMFADYEGTGRFALAFATTMALTWTLKLSINAERPNGGPYALPSGHTASVFSAASFTQRRYGWAVGVPYYVAAAYTGWSRVRTNNHYWRDVGVGAAIAFTSSLFLVPRLENRIQLLPFGEGGMYGLRIQKEW